MTPKVIRLIESVDAPKPSPSETAWLIASLEREMRAKPMWRQIWSELAVARAQILIFPAAFWLVSAIVMLVGAGLIALGLDPSRSLVFYLVGPLLAFVGMESAFSAASQRVLELELATPISPRRLAVARLVVMLGYEVAVGLVLTSALRFLVGGALLALTLTWLMPLLLASGITLLLSVRLSVHRAAAAVYAAWTAAVLAGWRLHGPDVSIGMPLELALAAAGLILVVTALAFFAPTQIRVTNLLSSRRVTES